jgi:hypothetical protein
MCLLVLVVAGAVVLRDGLREGHVQRATKPPRTRRAPVRGRRPVRSGVLLLASTTGIGIATGLALGLLGVAIALALKSFGGDGP